MKKTTASGRSKFRRKAQIAVAFAGAALFLGLLTIRAHAAAPAGQYTIAIDNLTVRDNLTMLVWQRCAAGLSGATCTIGTAPSTMIWSDAVAYCPTLGSGWRLPTGKELESIIDRRAYNPAIDTAAFPNTPTYQYWSSSSYSHDGTLTWSVDFYNGGVSAAGKTGYLGVRCVRGGP